MHEDAFTTNTDKGLLVDQSMTREMARGKEDKEMAKKEQKSEQQELMKERFKRDMQKTESNRSKVELIDSFTSDECFIFKNNLRLIST